jgi:integrase
MFTGTRRGEALGLTWARVDRARGVVMPDAEQTKTDEPRKVRLNDHSDAVLARRWKDGAEYVFAGQN